MSRGNGKGEEEKEENAHLEELTSRVLDNDHTVEVVVETVPAAGREGSA
jgi:hypothetical protein